MQNPSRSFERYFTDASAWDYVADQLEAGCDVSPVKLNQPPGKTGYVLNLKLDERIPTLYVKLQLGTGIVIGRSFHYSKRTENSRKEK